MHVIVKRHDAAVAGIERRFDGAEACMRVPGAERLHAAPRAVAGRQHGVGASYLRACRIVRAATHHASFAVRLPARANAAASGPPPCPAPTTIASYRVCGILFLRASAAITISLSA